MKRMPSSVHVHYYKFIIGYASTKLKFSYFTSDIKSDFMMSTEIIINFIEEMF